VTTIRALVTPQPMREMRVKGQYTHHKEIKGAQGVKIVAQVREWSLGGLLAVAAHGAVGEHPWCFSPKSYTKAGGTWAR
jgi:translation initiation factor IF-2